MSDYTQSTFFAPKDLLATGNPNKIIYGSDVDAELSAISTAIATKADVNGDAIGAGTPCTELSVDNLKLDANKIISTNTDGDIELEPDGTGIVTISSDVGIGTTSPATALDVVGTVTADGADLDGAVVINESGADVDFRVESDNNTHMLFVDAGNNRIGFNLSSPAKDFHYKFTGATDVSALLLESSGSDKYGVYLLSGFTTEMGRVGALSQADGDLDGASIAFMDFGRELEFRTGEGVSNAKVTYISKTGLLTHEKAAIFNESGGNNDFRVESSTNTHAFFLEGSSGNVGIGTTSPSQALDVVGSIEVSGGIYLGGTVAANLLDDYEEGTWTPTTASDATGVISGENGTYIKVGSLVYCSAIFSVTTNFTSDQIGGLPFNVKAPGGSSFVGKYISYTSTSAVDFTVLTTERLKFDTTLNTTNDQYRMMFVYEAA